MGYSGEIPATYTGGVLKPDERLNLPDGARVTVRVQEEQPAPKSRDEAWQLIERIRREGLIRLRAGRYARDELYDRR